MVEETPEIEQLVDAVSRGAGYRNLDRALVRMIAAQELAKGRRSKEAVKTTRNKLHQLAGAYQEGGQDWRGWLHEVQGMLAEGGDVRPLCRRKLMGHASSRERLPVLDSFYATVFAGLAPGECSTLRVGSMRWPCRGCRSVRLASMLAATSIWIRPHTCAIGLHCCIGLVRSFA
ncbi:MAG: hypothetical protein IPK16_20400 [Anaerolineales bacterium]|nr:hypothetical protein [Anaerolineales bacterium]